MKFANGLADTLISVLYQLVYHRKFYDTRYNVLISDSLAEFVLDTLDLSLYLYTFRVDCVLILGRGSSTKEGQDDN